MKYAIIGGDERMAYLADMLEVAVTYGLERTPVAAQKRGCSVEAAVMAADVVILPVPAESGELVRAPLAAGPIPMDRVTELISPGTLVLGGKLSEKLIGSLEEKKLRVVDYYALEEYALRSADATAEGVVRLLLEELGEKLSGKKLMITGFGRIGKLTARRLQALGADVTVTARKKSDLAWAEVLNYRPVETARLEDMIGEQRAVINTIPYVVMGESVLRKIGGDTFIIETASTPGYDTEAAKKLGVRVVNAGGLPGRFTPKTAAEDIYKTIIPIIMEG